MIPVGIRWALILGLALGLVILLTAFARPHPPLRVPPEARVRQAPDSFLVDVETSRGRFTVKAVREWAPLAVDRFHSLVAQGFYDGARFYRVVPGFVAQFGMKGEPAVDSTWMNDRLPDEPRKVSNTRGRVTFARGGPRTRTTQLFINLADNSRLDDYGPPGEDGTPLGFVPFAEVVEGMEVVDSLYGGYGEGAPRGGGPDQLRLRAEGNAYLDREFPLLDRIVSAKVRAAGP